MKKKEILIIFLLAVLLTILTFNWWEGGVRYKLAPGTPYYPWPFTFIARYQWWFPFHVFVFWFTALGVGWSTVEILKTKNKLLKILSLVFLAGITTLTVLIIKKQIPHKLIFWSLVLVFSWWVVKKLKTKNDNR